VNVDVTPILKGYYADASKTFFAGQPGPDARKIVEVARQSLRQGMAMVNPGNRVATSAGRFRPTRKPRGVQWSANS